MKRLTPKIGILTHNLRLKTLVNPLYSLKSRNTLYRESKRQEINLRKTWDDSDKNYWEAWWIDE